MIAAVSAARASLTRFASSDILTLFDFTIISVGVCLGHNDISIVLYKSVCCFGSILVTVIFTSCKS